MEFALPTVFVVPVSNALPVSGSTQNLVAGKFGIFKDSARTIATAGNVATADFIQFFQGREASIAAVTGSKPSDRIKASKVLTFRKITGSATFVPEIVTIGAFNETCGQDVTVSITSHSNYIDAISYNGFTRSVTIKTPCCACGVAPCTTIDNEAMVDLIIAKMAQYNSVQTGTNTLNINTFFTFAKTGTGAGAVVTITGKALTNYAQPCDITANTFEVDRLWFNVYVYNGAPTTVDFLVANACNTVATVTVTQRSSYPRLTSKEVAQMEIDYYSYQSPAKHLFSNSGYNPFFESYVTAGTVYTQYAIKFEVLNQDDGWTFNVPETERVIIFCGPGEVAGIEAVLTPYLGAPVDVTGNAAGIVTSPVYP